MSAADYARSGVVGGADRTAADRAALGEADYLAILASIEALSEITTPDEFAPMVTRELGGLVGSDMTSLNEVDPPTGTVRFVLEPETVELPPDSAELLGAFAHEHPLIKHFNQTGDGSARRISDFCTPAEWHDNVLYQRFYQPVGIEHQMSITLPAPAPTIVAIAVNRESRDFGERDRAALNLIRPHVAHRWRVARDLATTHRLFAAASTTLVATGTRALALDDGQLSELTPGGLDLLDRYLGRPGPDGLPPRLRAWLMPADRASSVLRAQQPPPLPLLVERADRRLAVRYLPAAGDHPPVLMLTEHDHRPPAERLRLLGLSQREAEVLAQLTTGASNAAIAATLGLSPGSVKRYLDSVYLKLGVTGRVHAAATALDILAHHQPPGGEDTASTP
jgi:DNA-binding CsgD family transcriptional regulator